MTKATPSGPRGSDSHRLFRLIFYRLDANKAINARALAKTNGAFYEFRFCKSSTIVARKSFPVGMSTEPCCGGFLVAPVYQGGSDPQAAMLARIAIPPRLEGGSPMKLAGGVSITSY